MGKNEKSLFITAITLTVVLSFALTGCGYDCRDCEDGNSSSACMYANYVVCFQIINSATFEILLEGSLEAHNNNRLWDADQVRSDIRRQLGFPITHPNDSRHQYRSDSRTVEGINQRILWLGITEKFTCCTCGKYMKKGRN